MGWESIAVVRFDLGPLFQGQTRITKLKSAYNTYFWSYRFGIKINLKEIMGWEFFGVVGFDRGPLLQGQTRIAKLESAYNSHIFGPTGLGWKSTHGISWAGNLLVGSVLTLDPSIKVK